jgi:hypothetical protein
MFQVSADVEVEIPGIGKRRARVYAEQHRDDRDDHDVTGDPDKAEMFHERKHAKATAEELSQRTGLSFVANPTQAEGGDL